MSDISKLYLIMAVYNDPEEFGHLEIMPLYYYSEDRISLDAFLETQVLNAIIWKLEEWGIEAQLTVYPVPEFISSTKCGLFSSDGTEIELIEKQNFEPNEETVQ